LEIKKHIIPLAESQLAIDERNKATKKSLHAEMAHYHRVEAAWPADFYRKLRGIWVKNWGELAPVSIIKKHAWKKWRRFVFIVCYVVRQGKITFFLLLKLELWALNRLSYNFKRVKQVYYSPVEDKSFKSPALTEVRSRPSVLVSKSVKPTTLFVFETD